MTSVTLAPQAVARHRGGVKAPLDILQRAAELRATGEEAVMATVVASRGSTPRKAGARALFFADGRVEGTIGGGRVEHVVAALYNEVMASGQARLVEHQLTTELGMCCGGQMTFFVEPLLMKPTLLLLGCGHVGRAVLETAAPLGFDVVACDDRAEFAVPERLRRARRIIDSFEGDELEAVSDIPWGERLYIVIATCDHDLDQRLLEFCLTKEFHYLGVIGSQRKALKQQQRLAAKDVDPQRIAQVHCPIGIDIAAETPEEIAISICAELVAHRRGANPSG